MLSTETSSPISLESLLDRAFVHKQITQSLPGLHALAGEGNIGAAVALAQIYFVGGKGVHSDYAAAKHWLDIVVSECDSPYAFHQLGIIHLRGLGVPPSHTIAYKYFRRAALGGYAKSLFMVGAMQKDGDGVLKKKRSGKTILARCTNDHRLGRFQRFLALAYLLTPGWNFRRPSTDC